MSEPTSNSTSSADEQSVAKPSSMAESLKQLLGSHLDATAIKKFEQELGHDADSGEDLEALLAEYAHLIEAWTQHTDGPAMSDVIEKVQEALRGLIPTGEGVIDEKLTFVVGSLTNLKEGSFPNKADAWQMFFNLIKDTYGMVNDISEASKVTAEKLRAACGFVVQAIGIFQPERAAAYQALHTSTADAAETISLSTR